MVIKMKKWIKSNNFPYFVLLVILIILYSNPYLKVIEDDILFQNAFSNGKTIWEFMRNRYMTWSSRIMIETMTVILTQVNMIVWRILNIGIYLLLAKSISKICFVEKNQKVNAFICISLLLFPTLMLASAGWIATSTNYLWVASMGIFSLSVIIDKIKEKRITIIKYIAYLLTGIYACNHEQMAIIMFLVIGTFLGYCIYQKGIQEVIKNQKFLILFLLIVFSSLIIIGVCPGNKMRYVSEIEKWYPSYENFNIIQKGILGISVTAEKLMGNFNILYILFSMILFVGIYQSQQEKIDKILVGIPLLSSLLTTIWKDYFVLFLTPIWVHLYKIEPMEIVEYPSIAGVMIVALYMMILIIIGRMLYQIFKRTNKCFYVLMIYSLGLLSGFVMGFSPTVYASGERPFIFLSLSLIICSTMILNEMKKKES